MNTLAARAARSPLLCLGRVSNLPTVWSNVLAGTLLAGGDPSQPGQAGRTALVVLAVSAFYEAGMYLNDAFDRVVDARDRPGRPIPSGRIAASAVFAIGFALLALGVLLLAALGVAAAATGLALAATIVAYDLWHKGNPFSPLVMGACRAQVYLLAAVAAAGVDGLVAPPVLLGAAALLAHVVGLTYAAKQESLDRVGRLWPLAVLAAPPVLALAWRLAAAPAGGPPLACALGLGLLAAADVAAVRLLVRRAAPGDVPRAVARLIAASALVDTLWMATAGADARFVAAGALAWLATRALQRVVPGT